MTYIRCDKCEGDGFIANAANQLIVCDVCNGEGRVKAPSIQEILSTSENQNFIDDSIFISQEQEPTKKRGRPSKNKTSTVHNEPQKQLIPPPVSNNVVLATKTHIPDTPIEHWTTDEIQAHIGKLRREISLCGFILFSRGIRHHSNLCEACGQPKEGGVCVNADCFYGQASY